MRQYSTIGVLMMNVNTRIVRSLPTCTPPFTRKILRTKDKRRRVERIGSTPNLVAAKTRLNINKIKETEDRITRLHPPITRKGEENQKS